MGKWEVAQIRQRGLSFKTMHTGRLPLPMDPPALAPGIPPQPSRRSLLRGAALVLASAFGAGVTYAWLRGVDRETAQEPAQDEARTGATPIRGTLAFALSLRHAEPAHLLPNAGDLERIAARHHNESRLVPVFTRMLDLALSTEPGNELYAIADAAAACAIRALDLLGAHAPIHARSAAISARQDMELAVAEWHELQASRSGSRRR